MRPILDDEPQLDFSQQRTLEFGYKKKSYDRIEP